MRILSISAAFVILWTGLGCRHQNPTEPGLVLSPVVVQPASALFLQPGDSMVFTAFGGDGLHYNFAVFPNSFDAFEWKQQGTNKVKVTRKVYDKYHQPGGDYLLYVWSPKESLNFHDPDVVFTTAKLNAW